MMKTSLGEQARSTVMLQRNKGPRGFKRYSWPGEVVDRTQRKGQYEGDVVFHLEGDPGPCGDVWQNQYNIVK